MRSSKFFNYPMSYTMTPVFTQSLTEVGIRKFCWWYRLAGTYGWQPHDHLCVDCLECLGLLTSDNPISLQGLLTRITVLYFTDLVYFTNSWLQRKSIIVSSFTTDHALKHHLISYSSVFIILKFFALSIIIVPIHGYNIFLSTHEAIF
jgi:hypothetical protein